MSKDQIATFNSLNVSPVNPNPPQEVLPGISNVQTPSEDFQVPLMPFNNSAQPTTPTDLNGNGYSPTQGDVQLLARAMMAEGSNTPQDMAALGWAMVNRVGQSEFGQTLNDVIYQVQSNGVAEFSFTTDGSSLFTQAENPDQFTGDNATNWQTALTTAQGILGGSIADPTGGATFYFASRTYDGTPANAPDAFFRSDIRRGILTPSTYTSAYAEGAYPAPKTNFFFIETHH